MQFFSLFKFSFKCENVISWSDLLTGGVAPGSHCGLRPQTPIGLCSRTRYPPPTIPGSASSLARLWNADCHNNNRFEFEGDTQNEPLFNGIRWLSIILHETKEWIYLTCSPAPANLNKSRPVVVYYSDFRDGPHGEWWALKISHPPVIWYCE